MPRAIRVRPYSASPDRATLVSMPAPAQRRHNVTTGSEMMKINPYMQFGGKCAQAFEYYRQHLGAKDITMMPFRGSPAEQHAPPEWLDKIMHGALTVDGQVLMGSDGMAGQPFEGMHGCSLALNVDTPEQAERLFGALADGGNITAPMEPTFFALKFGMLTDRFGVAWMVICEKPHAATATS